MALEHWMVYFPFYGGPMGYKKQWRTVGPELGGRGKMILQLCFIGLKLFFEPYIIGAIKIGMLPSLKLT